MTVMSVRASQKPSSPYDVTDHPMVGAPGRGNPHVPSPIVVPHHDAHRAARAMHAARPHTAMEQWHLENKHKSHMRQLVTDQQVQHITLQQAVAKATEERQVSMHQMNETRDHVDYVNTQLGHAHLRAIAALDHIKLRNDISRRPQTELKADARHLRGDEAAVHAVYSTILKVSTDYGHESANKTAVVADHAAKLSEEGHTLQQTMHAMATFETKVPSEVKTLWTAMIQQIHQHCGHPGTGASHSSALSFGALSIRAAISSAMTILLTTTFKQIAHEMPGMSNKMGHMYHARAHGAAVHHKP